jgi:hypothetical protein
MLFLQALRGLVLALPAELSYQSVLCFEQGISLFMVFFTYAMNLQIIDSIKYRAGRRQKFLFVTLTLIFSILLGVTMNILTYYGV